MQQLSDKADIQWGYRLAYHFSLAKGIMGVLGPRFMGNNKQHIKSSHLVPLMRVVNKAYQRPTSATPTALQQSATCLST